MGSGLKGFRLCHNMADKQSVHKIVVPVENAVTLKAPMTTSPSGCQDFDLATRQLPHYQLLPVNCTLILYGCDLSVAYAAVRVSQSRFQ